MRTGGKLRCPSGALSRGRKKLLWGGKDPRSPIAGGEGENKRGRKGGGEEKTFVRDDGKDSRTRKSFGWGLPNGTGGNM